MNSEAIAVPDSGQNRRLLAGLEKTLNKCIASGNAEDFITALKSCNLYQQVKCEDGIEYGVVELSGRVSFPVQTSGIKSITLLNQTSKNSNGMNIPQDNPQPSSVEAHASNAKSEKLQMFTDNYALNLLQKSQEMGGAKFKRALKVIMKEKMRQKTGKRATKAPVSRPCGKTTKLTSNTTATASAKSYVKPTMLATNTIAPVTSSNPMSKRATPEISRTSSKPNAITTASKNRPPYLKAGDTVVDKHVRQKALDGRKKFTPIDARCLVGTANSPVNPEPKVNTSSPFAIANCGPREITRNPFAPPNFGSRVIILNEME